MTRKYTKVEELSEISKANKSHKYCKTISARS